MKNFNCLDMNPNDPHPSKNSNDFEFEILESYDLVFPFSSVSIVQKASPSLNVNSNSNSISNPTSNSISDPTSNSKLGSKLSSKSNLDPSLFYVLKEPVLSPAFQKLLQKIISLLNVSLNPALFDLDDSIFLSAAKKEARGKCLQEEVLKILHMYSISLSEADFSVLFYYLRRDFLEFGRIQPFLDDPNIEDISENGYNLPIYVYHKKYGSVRTNIFLNESESDTLIRRMAQCAKKQISVAFPMVDAMLPNGSRVQLTLGNEITTKGSTFTIRKFDEHPLTPSDLVANQTFMPEVMAYLELLVESGMSLMFAGGTASGKTTSLNAVCHFIPSNKKIVSIEDTREINLPHLNWISGLSRESGSFGSGSSSGSSFGSGNFGGSIGFASVSSGQITLYDLLKSALRQRPEYILVGEIRGSEAYVLFQAMSTGHATISTMHAESVDTLIHRLENPPMNVPRAMIQTLDVLVILSQVRMKNTAVRKCIFVYEILETDPHTSEVLTQEIFNFYSPAEMDLEKSAVLNRVRERRGWTAQALEKDFRRRVFELQKSAENSKTKSNEGADGFSSEGVKF
ncbi:type II/IV secretion system ATPase subunit [Methanolapillus ohkumae]|uniref:Bacterial type II secretion system protein E domain-containing protein n=1 Tax=Methanolapillus ohkumae TaxID=3028298 RepID=A0AA96V6Z4_9EURY|nr:hypothetical protein MsAm2_07940 [Methanosarcinaceae archaeon Am2]